jgi:hypothetical protein
MSMCSFARPTKGVAWLKVCCMIITIRSFQVTEVARTITASGWFTGLDIDH